MHLPLPPIWWNSLLMRRSLPRHLLHGSQPDIAHLHIFGCTAYVHLPEDVQANKMAPKSELMVYIGVAPGNESNFLFMRSPNNVLFTSAHALFDEACFPCCAKPETTNKASQLP